MEADSSSQWRWSRSARELLSRYRLYSDLRLKLFARIFALGTISHELEFSLEQVRVGPLTEYMERWSRIIPSVGWSSRTGLVLHGANITISLLILILPGGRELLCLLAGTFLLSELASPARIASHCSMMAGGLLVILILGVGEWIERAELRRRVPAGQTAWYAFTLVGLQWICALTYFFAFFSKLNPSWFSDKGSAPSFLINPIAPFLDLFMSADSYRRALAPIAIYGTLAIELSLPVLLFVRRTRLLGCLIGLVFSLGMVAQGVYDFTVLIVAFYLAFLSLAQAQELYDRCLTRPGIARLTLTAIFAATWFIRRQQKTNWMYHRHDLPTVLMVIYSGLGFVCFILMIYIAVTMAAWLWERETNASIELADADEGRCDPSRADRASFSRPATSAVAAAAVVLVSAAFVYDNLAGFFALPCAGALIMFSGLSPDLSNHYLLSRTALSESFEYVSIASLVTTDSNSPAAREFGSFAQWLRLHPHPYQVNLNEVRYHMSRICDSAVKPTVKLSLVTRAGETVDFDDVCAAPEILWYVPLPVVSPCLPRCNEELARRAREIYPPTIESAEQRDK